MPVIHVHLHMHVRCVEEMSKFFRLNGCLHCRPEAKAKAMSKASSKSKAGNSATAKR